MTDAPTSDDFVVARNFKRGGTSSQAAAGAAKSARLGDTHRKIWAALLAEPRTADEIARDLRLVLNTARARCTDLLNGGWIERTGATRATGAGRAADVLTAVRKKQQT